jgi:hypothetical protein
VHIQIERATVGVEETYQGKKKILYRKNLPAAEQGYTLKKK